MKTVLVQKDHRLEVPRRDAPWLGAGERYLTLLHFKRPLLVDEWDRVYAWTVCKDLDAVAAWHIDPRDKPGLLYPIRLGTNGSGRWTFTIPQDIQNSAWLPEPGQPVIRHITGDEVSFWLPRVYNVERLRE